MTAPGIHLVHQEQMEGFKHKIPVQLVKQAPESDNINLSVLYKKLFALQKQKVFQEGEIERLKLNMANNSHCFGFHRFTPDAHAFILANFSATGIAIEFQHPSTEPFAIETMNVLSTSADKKNSVVHYAENVIRVHLLPHEGLVITC